MAINRIIVDKSVYKLFIEKFIAQVKQLRVGDPEKLETAMDPIINQAQLNALQMKITTAKQQGATLVMQGEVNGLLMSPYIFADVTPDMQLSTDDIFGPIVGIQCAENEPHALELANSTIYGFSSAVFSSNLDRGLQFARKIKAGMAHVNDMPVNDEAHMPFGGEKESGLGRFNGDWAINEFTTVQWVSLQRAAREYPF